MAEELHKPVLMIKVLDFLWAGPEESLFWPDDNILKRQVPIRRQMPFWT